MRRVRTHSNDQNKQQATQVANVPPDLMKRPATGDSGCFGTGFRVFMKGQIDSSFVAGRSFVVLLIRVFC